MRILVNKGFKTEFMVESSSYMAGTRVYTASFELDVSKIPKPTKDVPTRGLHCLLTKNWLSVIIHCNILHDPEKCIETLRIMEQNKILEVVIKVAYFDWSVYDRKFMNLLQSLIECGLYYFFDIVIYSRGWLSDLVIVLQIRRGNSEHARISEIVTTTIGH